MLSNQSSLPFLTAPPVHHHRTVAGLNEGGVEHTNKTWTQAYKCKNKCAHRASHLQPHTHTHTSLETLLPLPFRFLLKIVLIFGQWWALCGSGSFLTAGLVTVTSASDADGLSKRTDWTCPRGGKVFLVLLASNELQKWMFIINFAILANQLITGTI